MPAQPLPHQGVGAQVFGLVDAEQHDHEQEQHDDGAGVDDDLHRGQEVGLERDEQDGHAEQREHQAQGAAHRVLAEDDAEGAAQDEQGREGEDEGLHQLSPDPVSAAPSPGSQARGVRVALVQMRFAAFLSMGGLMKGASTDSSDCPASGARTP